MANLIIKPTSGGSLILQDEGGDAAITVGTTGATTFAENATMSGVTTLANATITAGTFPAGMVVQTSSLYGHATNETITNSPTTNTWYATVVTGAITPSYSNSSIIINAKWSTRIADNGGDAGYGFKFYRTATGITASFPDGVSGYDGAGSAHTQLYRDGHQYTTLVDGHDVSWMDPNVSVADTPVTYTLYHAVYNVSTAISSGAPYESRWDMFLQEIKR